KPEAEKAGAACSLPVGVVKSVQKKSLSEAAPLLHDLTSLQKECNKKLGLTAERTLEFSQALYEGKFITYPRTGSRYIGDDIFEQVPGLIKSFAGGERYGKQAEQLSSRELGKRSVDSNKVTDHHAIIPTGLIPTTTGSEIEIYWMIVARFLEAFMPSCKKEVTTVSITMGENFIAKWTVILEEGWRAIQGVVGDSEEVGQELPELKENQEVSNKGLEVVRKVTKPKPLHTEATLLDAMLTCGKDLEDEDLREAMKDSGLGTPATRAAIIETLFNRAYIERQKKSLVPTDKGLGVVRLVKEMDIAKPELTGNWEKMLLDIERGKASPESFMSAITYYSRNLTSDILDMSVPVVNTACECPKCKSNGLLFVKNKKLDALACENRSCGFILFREVAGKSLSDSQLKLLASSRATGKIKGFKSKAGKAFEAS
ncbi:MAG: DNA topoisomerase, partial [Flammeovirgaceae bacterium]